MKESPLFSRSYDFIRWLIPLTIKFPREQRFVLAARLQQTALDYIDYLYGSLNQRERVLSLHKADAALKKTRFYLRLCHDLQLLSTRQYQYASERVEEIGRLLGAWLKKLHSAG